MFVAAALGHLEALDLLLTHTNYKEVIDLQSTVYRRTPIVIAARNGHIGTVKALCRHGADLTRIDSNGDTALAIASNHNKDDAAAFLENIGR